MRSDNIKSKTFTRRAFILGCGKLGLFGVLAGRLYYLQVKEGEQFETKAEDNRIRLQFLSPPRGRILDRNGVLLAGNETNYELFYDKSHNNNFMPQLEKAASLLQIPEEEVKEITARLTRARRNELVEIIDNLTWEQVTRLEVSRVDMPSMEINFGLTRSYPMREMASHILGYTGSASKSEEKGKALYRMPDFKVGKNGIEKIYDETLQGHPGVKRMEVNAHGVTVREISNHRGLDGRDVYSAIDAELQVYAYEALQENNGSIVVMDIKTGEILCMVSKPGYNPAALSRSMKPGYWKQLMQDTNTPLINKCISGLYPPGSTFKLITALAALEAGVINNSSTVFCPGHMDLGNRRFHCWKRGGHGTVNLKQAIAESCDIYFYKAGLETGIDRIAGLGRRFGMGLKSGIDLPGEKAGVMPDQDWKGERYRQPWLAGETLNCAIGQGYVLTTPLQVTVMTAMLANGGFALKPTTIKNSADQAEGKSQILKRKHLDIILDGMYACTNERGGTAYANRIMQEGMEMAGKTGTAQVKKILRSATGSSLKESRREFKHHAWYTGFAPYNTPRFAITVLVDHGESGSAAAAPIARDVLVKCQNLFSARSTDGETAGEL